MIIKISHGNNISVIKIKNSKIIRKISFDNYLSFYLFNERDMYGTANHLKIVRLL